MVSHELVEWSNHTRLAGACPGEGRGRLFTKPSNLATFSTFYKFIKDGFDCGARK
jgi:hypothetical protein